MDGKNLLLFQANDEAAPRDAGSFDSEGQRIFEEFTRGRPGWVYFVQDHDGNLKIGYSTDVPSRIAALQTAHAKRLRLLGKIRGSLETEKEWHELASSLRVRPDGEWFEPHDLLVKMMRDAIERGEALEDIYKELARNPRKREVAQLRDIIDSIVDAFERDGPKPEDLDLGWYLFCPFIERERAQEVYSDMEGIGFLKYLEQKLGSPEDQS